ncbi:hypothetical protein D9M69_554420 [compost metagenome]
MGRRGADESNWRDVIHSKTTIGLTFAHALGHDARTSAVGNRKTISDQEDDIFRLGFIAGRIHIPVDGLCFIASGNFNLVIASLTDLQVAQDQGRAQNLVFSAFFFSSEFGLAAKYSFVVLAIDGNFHVLWLDDLIELNLEIERRVDKDCRPVNRIDGCSTGCRRQHSCRGESKKQFAHIRNPHCVMRARLK